MSNLGSTIQILVLTHRRHSPHDVAELEDCSVAIDATYWLSQVLDSPTGSEPLLPALGGLTGLEAHINEELDQWEKHRMIPFFIFDGQSLTGQDEVSLRRGLAAAQKTNEAWELYFDSKATEAVDTFGRYPGKSPVGHKRSRMAHVVARCLSHPEPLSYASKDPQSQRPPLLGASFQRLRPGMSCT